jgi:hypothetical protein
MEILTITFALLVAATPAHAQEIDYSTQAFKNLALQRVSETHISLEGEARESFFESEAFDLFGWDSESWSAQGPEIREWCQAAIGDSQVVLGETDRHGQGLMTAEAVSTRCSQVYDYALNVSHSCESSSNDKGQTFMSCTVSSELEWRHWVAGVANGSITFSLDDTWQDNGTHLIEVEGGGSVEIKGDVTAAIARRRALNNAAHNTGANLMREMLDVPEFRTRAPLVRVEAGSAYNCLSDSQVYLDMPFIVTIPTEDGLETVGFVKVREMYQGCDETPSLAERRAEGEEIILEPTRNQIIIGGGDIMQGMTAEQLPSMGVSVGSIGGATPYYEGESGARIGLVAEYSLARMSSISELHAVIKVGAHLALQLPGAPMVIMTDYQLLKRQYFGRLFADGAVGISAGFSDFQNQKTPDIYGGVLDVGVGMQVDPRILIRTEVGYRMQVGALPAAGLEFGLVTTWLL